MGHAALAESRTRERVAVALDRAAAQHPDLNVSAHDRQPDSSVTKERSMREIFGPGRTPEQERLFTARNLTAPESGPEEERPTFKFTPMAMFFSGLTVINIVNASSSFAQGHSGMGSFAVVAAVITSLAVLANGFRKRQED